ncbi:MAG: transcription-repair coupling factor [Bauldia sp.]|nr:transcription-repair coupling factor [Bauldia sp.]
MTDPTASAKDLIRALERPATTLAGVPDGFDARVLADLLAVAESRGVSRVIMVARDGNRVAELERSIRFFAPNAPVVSFPAWDCMPYDRVSPHPTVVARRMAALAELATAETSGKARLVLTTVNAVLQRVATRERIAADALSIAAGDRVEMDRIARWVEGHGFQRVSTVREPGEYAVRGGILDLYPAGQPWPARLDYFGDTLESIRAFDPETQRTTGRIPRLQLLPTSEVILSRDTIARFRANYVAMFGAADQSDLLYHAVSEGRRIAGVEHWLPLFGETLDTLFDYAPDAPVVIDHLATEAVAERLDQIKDHYDARAEALQKGDAGGGMPYKPVPPARLYLTRSEWLDHLAGRSAIRLSPFVSGDDATDLGGRQGRSFAAERNTEGANVFDALIAHAEALHAGGRRVVVACWSEGSRDRMGQVLSDRGLTRQKEVADWPAVAALPKGTVGLAILPLEAGFETADAVVISEQDVLGDRLVRPRQRRKRAADYLTEIAGLAPGDLVVHVDHGIGRFVGLATIEAAGAPHDCIELTYAGGDRLYLPVENLELLSRYGSGDNEVPLDKLGGVGWQSRKAKLKKRIREMAAQLIQVAAARMLRSAPAITPPEGLYDEFAARFPYEETDDQQAAIDAVLGDLAAGRPMDRLICGDVGFGKTEVALRAALVTAMTGRQVAIVVPTTLLARQHFKTFSERFKPFPLKIAQASRLVTSKELAETRKGMADGSVDIVVGTHALLGKGIAFNDLGLLIVDEEQHFGVKHKERLKELRADVHVLTLSATPIPRTLQLALTGVRELSMITTPPVDRLAVRTFISPFDPLTIREAILRERYRGGQTFYVCPRISDLGEAKAFLDSEVPEVKVAVAHGQLPPGELDQIMTAFYDGAYDVLLSTTIVESGLDIPTANTLIVHRADMFGLAQLYQLRGRVGRSKTRAYALFTVPASQIMTSNAERRLKVLQSLDTLGAGFQLASHDLDIRGAGNLLGEEQSGHIKEVGYELYQQMLEEAVAALKDGAAEIDEGRWSPQITIGTPVMIPESYVPDLPLRMSLYRRLAELDDAVSIDAFGAELIDRFGPLPGEVEHLLKIVLIKAMCRQANIEKLDAGPRGAVITLRGNTFPDAGGLVGWIAEQGSLAKIRPDQKIVVIRDWEDADRRLAGVAVMMAQLSRMAQNARKAAA